MDARTKDEIEVIVQALRQSKPAVLEDLAADLIGHLLGIPLSVSKGGFQHGGDAGTTGRQDRHLRVECKRYQEKNALGDRELQGEIDDAVRRDPSLDAWILVSTTVVSETTRQTLSSKADEKGIPVYVIDCIRDSDGMPELVALCAAAPNVVERHYGKQPAIAARDLAGQATAAIARIKLDLQAWRIGYDSLRALAEERLRSIWTDPAESRAFLAQNVAGGAAIGLVSRPTVWRQIGAWWQQTNDAPLVVHGNEGVGKTWATMQWIMEESRKLPIILTLASSALSESRMLRERDVHDLIASELHALAKVRTRDFWLRRLYGLLKRPLTEGPAILLLIDGINQDPSSDWEQLLRVLQGTTFRRRVRIVLTSQTHFLEGKLQGFRHISARPTRVGVEPYDLAPGGEFDQVLALHGMNRSSLEPRLVELARIPRLFSLVLKFRSEAALYGDATVSGLLWAYGRDEIGIRENRAFTDSDWAEWLLQVANRYVQRINASGASSDNAYSLAELSSSTDRPNLDRREVQRRLDEIVGGTWMEVLPGSGTLYRPKSHTLALALGAALLDRLEQVGKDQTEGALSHWMDPIGATSEAADILAAALAIAAATGTSFREDIVSTVLTAMLHSQNIGEQHRDDVRKLAPALVRPLLNSIERSRERAQTSARNTALDALRDVPEKNVLAWDVIMARLERWVAHATCPSPQQKAAGNLFATQASERLISRIGTDLAGVVNVLGVDVRLHQEESVDLAEVVPIVLQRRALVPAMGVFYSASVVAALGSARGDGWQALRWLVQMNEFDRPAVVAALVARSDEAMHLSGAPHIHADLKKRVAALLLWLTGAPDQEAKAATMRTAFDAKISYEEDYLNAPAFGHFFPLEYRHVGSYLSDTSLAPIFRLDRSQSYWPDPGLTAPKVFVDSLERIASTFDVSALDIYRSQRLEDLNFSKFEPGAARFVPKALASVTRRRLRALAGRKGESRRYAALRADEHLLLVGAEEAAAARALRSDKVPPDEYESSIAARLLELELLHEPPQRQLDLLAEEPGALMLEDLLDIMAPTTPEVIADFLARWGTENLHAVSVLLNYLARHPIAIGQDSFDRVLPFAFGDDSKNLRTLAFIALERCASHEFGLALEKAGWRLAGGQSVFEQTCGSQAILAAGASRPLDDLSPRVAPWCLLTEARRRGGSASDAKIAAAALDRALSRDLSPGQEGVEVSVDATTKGPGNISLRVEPPSQSDEPYTTDDPEFEKRQRSEVTRRANAYIEHVRESSVGLHAVVMPVVDAQLLVRHCSAEVDAWLNGQDELTETFRRRVALAEGLFLSLCEALLDTDPKKGTRLWRNLVRTVRVKFRGIAGIDDMMFMPFRAKASGAVLALREELYSIRCNPTDKDYLELVVCATSTGCGQWLSDRISADEASPHDWRRKRAIRLRGFLDCPPVDHLSWFEGPMVGSWDYVRRSATMWRNAHSLERHWWNEFVAATTVEEAYAAWQVFIACADRRAWVWVSQDLNVARSEPLWRLKVLHFEANRHELERKMASKEEAGSKAIKSHLLGWEAPTRWLDLVRAEQLCDESEAS